MMEQLTQISIDRSKIKIHFAVLEKMIGYAPGQMTAFEKEQLFELSELIESSSNLQAGFVLLDAEFDENEKTIKLENYQLATGSVILSQIKNAELIVIMACTIGHQLEHIVHEFRKNKDYLAEYYADIIGSAYVESLADYAHKQIGLTMKKSGMNITNRFSPGYCGWKVDEQKKLFKLVPAGFCGITLTNSALMQPIKSISAIIGVGKEVNWKNYNCRKCEKESCLYRETQKLI